MAANHGADGEKDNEFGNRLRVNVSGIDAIDDAPRAVDNADDVAEGDEYHIHQDARALFAKFPCLKHIPIFGNCCQGYGPRCTVSLGLVYFLNKGIGFNIIDYARFAMFTSRFGVSGVRYQRLSSMLKLGFSIKAVTAMMSDSVAFVGYTKRWYCAMACVIGGALTIGFGCLPPRVSSADIAAGFLFLTSFSVGSVDILSEGHYSRLMRRHPKEGPSLVSWIWWFILSGTIIAALIQGPLSDKKMPQVGLFIAGLTQIISTVFFPLNWYGERPNREEQLVDALALRKDLYHAQRECQSSSPLLATGSGEADYDQRQPLSVVGAPSSNAEGEVSDDLALDTVHYREEKTDDELLELIILPLCFGVLEINKDVCMRNWRILVYSVVMLCSVIAMICVTILGTRWQLLYTCIPVVVVCTAVAFWALPILIAKVSVYFFSYAFLYLQLPGALDSFYTASKECYPGGPNFTFMFYNTISAVIGNMAGIAAVAAFPYFFSKHSLRFTLVFTYSIQVLASLFDIIIVKRWNLRIGIPDHAMYLFGDAIIYKVSYYFAWMPTVVLLSRICPRGSESLVYALVAGFGHLGGSLSGVVGSLLMEFKLPIKTSTPCDFSNIPMLLLVGHILLPTLIVPLSFLLVPNARICDDIDVNGNAIKEETKLQHRKNRDEAERPISESGQ
ncbi:hypothetical protein JKF63_07103 [Porcisia hertigi]|uniref:Uncharacterized protein n=1 Tax=Porcisia hertigi TaxID=2761500 RepID=A0A836LKI3_9TRYP|nr:hypothetical protein JKF63_07103 [Porcisia hertigi]